MTVIEQGQEELNLDEEERLWHEVLDHGDTEALLQLADSLPRIDERELGEGD
ncbi:MAG: hypothetical protein ACYC8T_14260 [Myxococcaceae bacterium]